MDFVNHCNNTAFHFTEPFANTFSSLTAEVQRSQLLTECWFHGLISRPVAESLLKHDGEFLVRERKAKPGQYVLTGMQETTPKHLLLIDPAGVVSVCGVHSGATVETNC